MSFIDQPSAPRRSLGARLLANPVLRIVIGTLMVWLPAPLITKTAHAWIPRPYAQVWPTLLAAALVWVAYRLFVRRIERRALVELAPRGGLREFGAGLLIGVALQALLFGGLWLFGAYTVESFNAPGWAMLSVLPLYIGVALLEEFIGRGIVFGITEQSLGSLWAIAISAGLFGLAHAPNVGANLLGLVTCTAFGMLFAAAYMATRRLWLCIGLHLAWNFTESQVFSSAVSGTSDGAGLIQGHLSGPAWLTGGSFGAEGSVLALAIGLLGFAVFMSRASIRPAGRAATAAA